MGLFDKCEAALSKHHKYVSPAVLAISSIMVLNLITPTMLLASELNPNMTTDTPDVVRPVRVISTLPKNLNEEIGNNEKQIRSIRAAMEKFSKEGLKVSPSTTIKFNRASALITSLRVSSTTQEKLETKKEELKKLVASLQADQEQMARLRESIKKSNDLLSQANMTIAGMRNSLNRTRAFAKNDRVRAEAELKIFAEKAKVLANIAEKLSNIQQIQEDLSKLPTTTLGVPRFENRPTTGTLPRREDDRRPATGTLETSTTSAQ